MGETGVSTMCNVGVLEEIKSCLWIKCCDITQGALETAGTYCWDDYTATGCMTECLRAWACKMKRWLFRKKLLMSLPHWFSRLFNDWPFFIAMAWRVKTVRTIDETIPVHVIVKKKYFFFHYGFMLMGMDFSWKLFCLVDLSPYKDCANCVINTCSHSIRSRAYGMILRPSVCLSHHATTAPTAEVRLVSTGLFEGGLYKLNCDVISVRGFVTKCDRGRGSILP